MRTARRKKRDQVLPDRKGPTFSPSIEDADHLDVGGQIIGKNERKSQRKGQSLRGGKGRKKEKTIFNLLGKGGDLVYFHIGQWGKSLKGREKEADLSR